MSNTHDDWDPRDPSVLEDQRRAYDEMRERCPVAHSEFMGWSVFRHHDVAAVLADPETYSSGSRHAAIPNGMDPPAHGRYRDAAIEEILRVDDPLVANRRTTTREVELSGRTIPGGASLTLMWIAANRDPRAFDDPDAIRLDRNTDDGMVWGQGIHLCLGAPLARLEMRVAVEELLSRTKRFELGGEAPRRTIYPSNGLAALPLRFS